VRVWSWAGTNGLTGSLREVGLSSVGDVVLQGEVVVLTADGGADLELLTTRLQPPSG
jgi:hypothetical protein